jgi:hypothetical protein
MTRAIAKLMVLIAVLLMPLGMAPALAAPGHHQAMAAMPMGHCPDQAPSRDVKHGFAECTMACAAALPAVDARRDQPALIICTPVAANAPRALRGLHPDTATPPPKGS